MMFLKFRKKVESERDSEKFFWTVAVFVKDFLWLFYYYFLEFKKRIRNFFIKRKLFKGAIFEENIVLSPLLPKECYSKVFEDFKGKKIGFVRMPGNIGDWLIEQSAMQLFRKFGVDYKNINKLPRLEFFNKKFCRMVNEFAIDGGGNMGDFYEFGYQIRKSLFKYNKPITVLPQTFVHSNEDLVYKKIWVREKESLNFNRNALLAPDLALGYEYRGKLPKPKYKVGIWLRGDAESAGILNYESLGDPEPICNNPEEYIQLAALFEKIITDRLHFAILGLLAKREVVLLPNNYFKNFAMWEAWLKDLGCKWGADEAR